MSATVPWPAPAPLRIEYAPADVALTPDVLAAFVFGREPPDADPRWIRVGLQPLWAPTTVELWRCDSPVETGAQGPLRHAAGDGYAMGVIELDERAAGGLERAARTAYETVRARLASCAHPHLLRMWNYFDAINDGEGDDERYRRFCSGRAQGFGSLDGPALPAATAIGRRDGDPRLQVYWLAARTPGVALENPRQVSAWRYPRSYGPDAPRFSRAMRIGGDALLVSGTASVVGHATHHAGVLAAQFAETLANLASVLAAAGLPPQPSRRLLLKAYLRDPAGAAELRALLAQALPGVECLALAADVCRRDLLVEMDCVARLA